MMIIGFCMSGGDGGYSTPNAVLEEQVQVGIRDEIQLHLGELQASLPRQSYKFMMVKINMK